MKIKHEVDYRALRARAYPPLTELADALVHQANGDPGPLQAWVEACQKVKATFPKPPQKSLPSPEKKRGAK